MKVIKKVFIGLLAMIILFAIFITINIAYTKYVSYPKWVNEYVQNRYKEPMIIQKIYVSDMGYCAVVSPKTEPNLKFTVRGKYIDTYLERSLEYQVEQNLKSIYPKYDCVAQMFSYESIQTPFAELYKLYEEYERPPTWKEIPEYIRLERLRINTNQYVDNESINAIIKKMCASEFRTSIIEIYDGNILQTFQFEPDDNTFILK